MSFWPFIIYKQSTYPSFNVLENHELIHHAQQKELLIIPYHLFYLIQFIGGLLKHRNWNKAYRNVSFEQEAYFGQQNLGYLKNRRPFAWRKWL